jgi:hypothetical protein
VSVNVHKCMCVSVNVHECVCVCLYCVCGVIVCEREYVCERERVYVCVYDKMSYVC